MGKRLVVVRHPMPYGDLTRQAVQRFATMDDLTKENVTIEEREEYEPHIACGSIVYAGADYERILRRAEEEADMILWDGGNNDMPFFQPDLLFVVADPHRPGHELTFYPGETNLRMADVVVINKIDSASQENIARVRENIRMANANAVIVEVTSPISIDEADAEAIRGKRVLVVEDGPTLTHGGMSFGAGILAARKFGASEIIDPRPDAPLVSAIAAQWTPAERQDREQRAGLARAGIDADRLPSGEDCRAVLAFLRIMELGELPSLEQRHRFYLALSAGGEAGLARVSFLASCRARRWRHCRTGSGPTLFTS